jgi:hypothetical protein
LLAKALLETLVAPEMLATPHRVLEIPDEAAAQALEAGLANAIFAAVMEQAS